MSMGSHNGMILIGKNQRIHTKTFSSVTLSTTNATWNEPGKNLDLCSESTATNHLSHGTASQVHYIINETKDNTAQTYLSIP
jgi:hypothetical protein